MLAFGLVRRGARLILPSFLLVFGIATFLGLSIRGFAVINRYLVISALALTVFAAFTLGGWSVLRGRGRAVLGRGVAVVVLLGVGWTVVALQQRAHPLGAAQPPDHPRRHGPAAQRPRRSPPGAAAGR